MGTVVATQVDGNPTLLTIDFPEQAHWYGHLWDLEKVREFGAGAAVTAHSLACSVALNGAKGKVVSCDGERYVVDFNAHGGPKSLKAENLHHASTARSEESSGATSFQVGDRVRVRPGVTPAKGWGAVRPTSVGTVASKLPELGGLLRVDFPEQRGWAGYGHELEKASGPAPADGGTGANPFRVGDRVRVRPGVTPSTGWGGVEPDSVGVIVEVGTDSRGMQTVDFPEYPGWHGLGSELERVMEFPVGSSVVAIGVAGAAHLNGKVGRVVAFQGDRYVVEFPGLVKHRLEAVNLKYELPNGSQVELFGLTTKVELNGTRGIVVKRIRDRVHVQFSDGKVQAFKEERIRKPRAQAEAPKPRAQAEAPAPTAQAAETAVGQALVKWLRDVAGIDGSSMPSVLETCAAEHVRTPEDLELLTTEDLLKVFPRVVARRIEKARSPPQSNGGTGASPSSRSGAEGGTASSGAPSSGGAGGEFVDERCLGRGGFGETWLATRAGGRFAVKRTVVSDVGQASCYWQEALLLAKLEHPFIVRLEQPLLYLEDLKLGRVRVNIVMEYCDGGDLAHRIQREPRVEEPEACRVLAHVALALRHIHMRNIAHRDVKPSNVLLCRRGDGAADVIKLSDFGLSQAVRDGGVSSRAVGGTLPYMPPDAFGAAGTPADLWALGRMAVELASGRLARGLAHTQAQLEALLGTVPAGYSAAYKDLAKAALSLEPEARPTAHDVVEHQAVVPHAPVVHGTTDVQASMADLDRHVRAAKWAAPLRVDGLQWECLGASKGSVKVSNFAPSACSGAERKALELLVALIEASAGNERFSRSYAVREALLCRCRHRENAFVGRLWDLEQNYRNRAAFDLERDLEPAASSKGAWQRQVLQYYERYTSLCQPADGIESARVLLSFHAAPSREVAELVLKGNFANLQKLDAGFFGSGIYATLDADYAIAEYGNRAYGLSVVPLIVCAVVMGNPFPVVESPDEPKNYLGAAIRSKADAHVAVVVRDAAAHGGADDPLPCRPELWDQMPVKTEVVLNESQVLPLAVLMVEAAAAPTADGPGGL